MALAKFYSRKRVLEAAKAAGIRSSSLGAAEINGRAVAYCEAHREEMIGKAIEAIRHSPKLRQLGQKEQRRREREKRSSDRALANAHSVRPSESQR
jgi:hypothetical protein